jgi:hypothetical protein
MPFVHVYYYSITLANYELLPHPKVIVVVGVRVKSLTEFVENACNICISK